MKMAFLILPLMSGILTVQPALARQMSNPGETVVSQPAPKSVAVMSMGKIEAIDVVTKRLRVNGVSYGIDPATLFFDRSGRRTQAARLKTGDWINFWIKSGPATVTPTLEQVVVLDKS